MFEDTAPLTGQGIGDALGKSFEGLPAINEDLKSWDGKTFHPCERLGLKSEQWTADTRSARIVAESIISCNGYYPRDVADRYLAWFKNVDDHRGMSPTIIDAMRQFGAGTPWSESGILSSQDESAAVRVVPIGTYYHEDIHTVIEFTKLDTRITHQSKEALDGSVAVATGVALLVDGKASRETLLQQVIDHVEDGRIQSNLKQVLLQIKNGHPTQQILARIGTFHNITATVSRVFAVFTLTNSYSEAVELMIRGGGNTNTSASIVGALAGAFYGLKGIPDRHWKSIEDGYILRRLETKLAPGPRNSVMWRL